MAVEKMVNGVKVHALFETIDARMNGPEVARFRFRLIEKRVSDISIKEQFP
jgi:hypothetical protein